MKYKKLDNGNYEVRTNGGRLLGEVTKAESAVRSYWAVVYAHDHKHYPKYREDKHYDKTRVGLVWAMGWHEIEEAEASV